METSFEDLGEVDDFFYALEEGVSKLSNTSSPKELREALRRATKERLEVLVEAAKCDLRGPNIDPSDLKNASGAFRIVNNTAAYVPEGKFFRVAVITESERAAANLLLGAYNALFDLEYAPDFELTQQLCDDLRGRAVALVAENLQPIALAKLKQNEKAKKSSKRPRPSRRISEEKKAAVISEYDSLRPALKCGPGARAYVSDRTGVSKPKVLEILRAGKRIPPAKPRKKNKT